jgi:hypothetical protein
MHIRKKLYTQIILKISFQKTNAFLHEVKNGFLCEKKAFFLQE